MRGLANPPHRAVGPTILATVAAYGLGGISGASEDGVSAALPGALGHGGLSGGREFFFEYRGTEIFDEPLTGMAMPDRLVTVGAYATTRRSKRFSVEGELHDYAEGAPDRFRTLVRFSTSRSATSWVGVGFSYHRSQTPRDPLLATEREQYWGGSLFVEAVGRLGANVDAMGQIQVLRGADDVFGARLEGLLDVALSPSTRARVRGWAFRDEDVSESTLGEVAIAQGLGLKTALHAGYRAYRSASDTTAVNSASQTVELRREIVSRRLLLRLGYRWYQDSQDVDARGPSIGFDYTRGKRTIGVFLRHYESSSELNAGSAWFTFRTAF
ncbi:MAG: hypothetical protein ACYTKD_28960 [Planctomycetota bacterium]